MAGRRFVCSSDCSIVLFLGAKKLNSYQLWKLHTFSTILISYAQWILIKNILYSSDASLSFSFILLAAISKLTDRLTTIYIWFYCNNIRVKQKKYIMRAETIQSISTSAEYMMPLMTNDSYNKLWIDGPNSPFLSNRLKFTFKIMITAQVDSYTKL